MTVQYQSIETPNDAPVPVHEGDPSRPPEVAIVLRDLRRSLLKHSAILQAVRELRTRISMRDFYVSMTCLLLGVGGQIYAVQYQPWLVPVFLFFFLMGFAPTVSMLSVAVTVLGIAWLASNTNNPPDCA